MCQQVYPLQKPPGYPTAYSQISRESSISSHTVSFDGCFHLKIPQMKVIHIKRDQRTADTLFIQLLALKPVQPKSMPFGAQRASSNGAGPLLTYWSSIQIRKKQKLAVKKLRLPFHPALGIIVICQRYPCMRRCSFMEERGNGNDCYLFSQQ